MPDLTDRDKLVHQLILHEGLKLQPYTDTKGKLTIGVGRNLTDVGITQAEALALLDHDIDRAIADLGTFQWFSLLDTVRQRVLVDMRFNLGPTGFRRFRKMIAALEKGDYESASTHMLDSLWAEQVGDRALQLAGMMLTGKDT